MLWNPTPNLDRYPTPVKNRLARAGEFATVVIPPLLKGLLLFAWLGLFFWNMQQAWGLLAEYKFAYALLDTLGFGLLLLLTLHWLMQVGLKHALGWPAFGLHAVFLGWLALLQVAVPEGTRVLLFLVTVRLVPLVAIFQEKITRRIRPE